MYFSKKKNKIKDNLQQEKKYYNATTVPERKAWFYSI